MSINQVASQFTGGTTLFGNSQAIQPSTKRSQMIPATSSTRSTSSSSGSSGDKSSDDGSSSYSFLGGKDGENSDSGSWSWSMESGSGSLSLEYECDCRSVRRVSLMGASDYCLVPGALLSSKCGNVDLGESGSCPMTGAQPCSVKGHVLANDSFCALDNKDETYKCVASKNDLEIQKNGKKKRKKSSRHHGPESSMSMASPHLLWTARQVLAVVVCMAFGMIAVV
ncbi:unnamed protein product [Peronospora farinosa]|uniref:Uncharacterized protein n=1 Tax=Peronospora farinosa TaxID=134698 RepID=A0AAV0SWN4_9STRA|nr:unnamed protein product [Peronospora farinosa]